MKSAVVVGPHPDDIEIGAGGTVARLVHEGWRVDLLILTSEPDEACARRRRDESLAAAGCLGVSAEHVHFAELPDTQLAQVPSAIGVGRIREIVRALGVDPDLVVVNSAADSHTDHQAAHALAVGAFRTKPFLFYPVINHLITSQFTPRLFVDTSAYAPQKRAALDRHCSQREAGRIHDADLDALDRAHGTSIGAERAEAFEVALQAGAGEPARRLIAELNDCPFQRFWSCFLLEESKLYVLYATPVVHKAVASGRRINHDARGLDLLNAAFSEYWHGPNPVAGTTYPAEADGATDLLDAHHVLLSGGPSSNRLTDRYFNHFAGLRFVIDHTMPGYRDLRVQDRRSNTALRPLYGTDAMGTQTILKDFGLLTVLRNPIARHHALIGCMGVHSPGSLGCFKAISNRLLLRELMELMPMPIPLDDDGPGSITGYQVLVEQDMSDEAQTTRLLRDTLHAVRLEPDPSAMTGGHMPHDRDADGVAVVRNR